MDPSGFIYHETRCGSTLSANMMAAVPTNIVHRLGNGASSIVFVVIAASVPFVLFL